MEYVCAEEEGIGEAGGVCAAGAEGREAGLDVCVYVCVRERFFRVIGGLEKRWEVGYQDVRI